MAKFCKNCGKQLADDEICTCQQATPQMTQQVETQQAAPQMTQQAAPQQAAPQMNPQGAYNQGYNANAFASQVSAVTGQLYARIVPMVKNPVQEIGDMVDNNETSMGVQMSVLQIVVNTVIAIIAMLALKSKLGSMAEYLDIPYVKFVLIVALATAAINFGLAALMMGISKGIFKSECGYGSFLCLVGSKAVAESAFTIVGAILCILHAGFGGFVVGLGSVLGLIYLVAGFIKAVDISEDAKVYALFIIYVAYVIILFIVVKLLLPDMSELKSSLSYLGL